MKREAGEYFPQARKAGMVIKSVDDEVLVYDLERDKAHCLNFSAAAIWRLCDGKSTINSLAKSLERETGTKVEERVIWLGLDNLRRSHLLEDERILPVQMVGAEDRGMSRREAVRRIGLGAAIALPIVISITAPTPVQAAVSCSAKCKPCNTGSECCSGVCINSAPGCTGSTKKCA